MLYLDASAWVKRYIRERGHESLEQRIRAATRLYSSAISYAEVHAVLASKYLNGELSRVEFQRARNDFERDWLITEEVAVDRETLSPVPAVVEKVRLRGMDVIHLSAVVWLQRKLGEAPEIVTSDRDLSQVAQRFGFKVFDPAHE